MDEPFSVRFESKKEFKKYAAFMTEIRKWYNAFVTHVDMEDGARIGDAETHVLVSRLVAEYDRLKQSFDDDKICPGITERVTAAKIWYMM
jgi:hypothetical protein